MADDTKPEVKPAPKKPAKPQDQAVFVGGAFIQGGAPGDDDRHYGGRVVNCDGEVLAEFGDDEVNDGQPEDRPESPHVRPRTLEQMKAAPAPKPAKPAAPLTSPPKKD